MPRGCYPRPKPTTEQLVARFWAKVDKSDSCWLWRGALSRGYGRVGFGSNARLAHRVAFEMTQGPIPHGLYVRHRCDNPQCVNPEHLELGTHADNMRDMTERGRAANIFTRATHCIHGHEFTTENTYRWPNGRGRRCRACSLRRRRERDAERRSAARSETDTHVSIVAVITAPVTQPFNRDRAPLALAPEA